MAAQLNRSAKSTQTQQTHEGAPAYNIKDEWALCRSVMSCLLWENEFYEDGETIAKRIAKLIRTTSPVAVAEMAIEAREKMKLRHVPLLMVREMARLETHRHLVASTLARVIQRPDELSEYVSLYWKDGKQPLSAQSKRGLAKAFTQFDSYSLAKYNRDKEVKLRDVLFLCHAKPVDKKMDRLWRQLVDGTLATPDTWEVALSAGQDKKATWERLIDEKQLGGLALLRNLRNMKEAGVGPSVIRGALKTMRTERILPFRFIAAARFAPEYEPELEQAMFKCLDGAEKLPGRTLLMVDVSGSMDDRISSKSDLKRIDAACGLAMLLREVCEDVAVFSFSNQLAAVPPRRGFALRDAIVNSQGHSGTHLGSALDHFYRMPAKEQPDRMIVITDEQSYDKVSRPRWQHSYMINVASAKNGVGYGDWRHVDGWSEAVVQYIQTYEAKMSGSKL